jgi:hypothetical protein
MWNDIYSFCKVRNRGGAHTNGLETQPRIDWILDFCKSNGIKYELDVFQNKRFPNNNFYNIILRGSGDLLLVAHHDIVRPNSDNANDNSASVINALMVKKLKPSQTVILLDGEEPPMMGVGSQRLADMINDGKFGSVKSVLNLELTGKGGKHFFIGNHPGPLLDKIKAKFDPPVVNVPFNDSDILRRNGIDSVVINPLPPLPEGETSIVRTKDGVYLDFSMVFNCHTSKDTVATISPEDMKEFTEEVLLKIL